MNKLRAYLVCVPVVFRPGYSVFRSPQVAFCAYQRRPADFLTPEKFHAFRDAFLQPVFSA